MLVCRKKRFGKKGGSQGYRWSNGENNEKVVGPGFGLEKGSIWTGQGNRTDQSQKGNVGDSQGKARDGFGPLGFMGRMGTRPRYTGKSGSRGRSPGGDVMVLVATRSRELLAASQQRNDRLTELKRENQSCVMTAPKTKHSVRPFPSQVAEGLS